MRERLFSWIHRYERHLAVVAAGSGFIIDQLFFERVDLWQTQALLAFYAIAAFVSILGFHYVEERAPQGLARPRLYAVLPLVTQFTLGGFWSAFIFFYGRSASLSASWPFLLLLLVVLIGNEYFSKYHGRLAFTSVLFFFALYAYAIFEVPILVGRMGTDIFLLSGLVAVGIFALFTALLRTLGRSRFKSGVWRIRAGALVVLAVINVFYFTNVLPPLPLAAHAAGVYLSVSRTPSGYAAIEETGQSWFVRYLGFAPTLHLDTARGETVSAYSAVFAPTALSTTIVHRWEWYDQAAGVWIEKARVAYPIVGGRDGGYRGYTTVSIRQAGQWRVSVETSDGRRIVRLPFTVLSSTKEPSETAIPLD